uniref:uncharacterized protein C9orf40 homolog n=1 Tax=Panthera onca TaxID=9690 RepID=UPI0029534E1B|nr:uncharacterized protein C9orf40 homolog [Panthera onca]
MAKRRAAEPLTFHVPWKRLLLCDFPEEPPPLWIPPPGASHPGQPVGVPEPPRKRKIDAGAMTEASASPSKRRDGGDTSVPGGVEREGQGLETGEPQLLQPPVRPRGPGEEPRGARPPRGGGDDGAGRTEPPRGDWGAAPRQVGAGDRLSAPEGGRDEERGAHPLRSHGTPREETDWSPLDSCSSRSPKRRKAGNPRAGRTWTPRLPTKGLRALGPLAAFWESRVGLHL